MHKKTIGNIEKQQIIPKHIIVKKTAVKTE